MKPTSLTQIAKYRVEGELGRGGMGVVYKAFDPVVERAVAIKTIRLDADNAEDLVNRLKREAKSVGHLEHPNIVTLYDAGEWEGLFYLAMQYVSGETLEKRIERQRWFTLQETYDLFRQACAGLDHAHQHGIIHRDIKPANIMITEDGVVKLADFGIAKVADAHSSTSGLIVGTPSYMSPEQALGRPLDGRSDIFSLGSILYEMVTGERAFPGEHATTVIYKIVHEAPIPVAALQPGIDPELEGMVLKAIAKRPGDRFQSCGELAQAIEIYLKQAAVAATRVYTPVAPPVAVPPAPIPSGQGSGEQQRAPAGSAGHAAPPPPSSPGMTPSVSADSGHSPTPVPAWPSGTQAVPVAPVVIPAATQQRPPYAWILVGATSALLIAVLAYVFITRSAKPLVPQQAAVNTPTTTSLAPSNAPAPADGVPPKTAPANTSVTRKGLSQVQSTPKSRPVYTPPKEAPVLVTPPVRPPDNPAPTPHQAGPETYTGLIVRGDVAIQQSKYEDALQAYLQAYRLNPRSSEARQKIALAYTLLGKPEEAAKYQ